MLYLVADHYAANDYGAASLIRTLVSVDWVSRAEFR